MGHQEHFSTDSSNLDVFRRVYVNSLNAFPAPVGDVITLVDGITYIFTRAFSLEANQFRIPDVGQVEFHTESELIDPLLSFLSDGKALFIGDVQRLVIRETSFVNVTGAGHFLGTATINSPSPTIILRRMFVIGFAAIGTVEGAFYITDNLGYIGCGAGLNLTNPNNKRAAVLIEDQQHDTQTGDHVSIFDQQRFLSIQNLVGEPDAPDSLLHLDSSITLPSPENVAGGGTGLITNGGFSDVNGGTFLTATSIQQGDKRFIFRDNYRSIDSNTIGSIGFKENSTATVITTINTYVDIDGTYADIELERMLRSGNELISDSLVPFKAIAYVNITARRDIPASSARTVRVAVFVDTGLGFVEQSDSTSMTMTGDPANLSFQVPISLLLETDKVKVQIKNEDTTDNIVVVDHNLTVDIA